MIGDAHQLIEKARWLEDVEPTFISLVKAPANRRGIVMKSDGTFEGEGAIHKYDESKGLLYFTGYEPNVEDTQGDAMTDAQVEKLGHKFLGKGLQKNVDYEHNYDSGYGDVVESFILRGQDPMFVGVRKGAWVGAIQLTEKGRLVADQIKGVSFAGYLPKRKSDDAPINLGFRTIAAGGQRESNAASSLGFRATH